MDHLLDNMAFDLAAVRVTGDDELLGYANRVSATVALMLAPLLGSWTARPSSASSITLIAQRLDTVLPRCDPRQG